VATSWQKSEASSGVVMALPPYLTTTVWPLREEMAEAMVMAFSAKEEDSDVGDDDVEMADLWCRDVDAIDGANACDVPQIDAARRTVLAENSFMVLIMILY